MIQVRSEIQALEQSFTVLTGSEENAAAMLEDLKSFAIESPLSQSGVAQVAQTLLAFNIEAEKVMPILRQIGDISMGDEEKFRSLTRVYSKMSVTSPLSSIFSDNSNHIHPFATHITSS
jgi:uncharacterized protein YpiB (UPF0302 family)